MPDGRPVRSRALWAVDTAVRRAMWRFGHRIRDARPPRSPHNRRVLHVTTSFDIGGSQTQIRHLCEATGTHFEHHATELFPELNYVFREDAAGRLQTYLRGGTLSRAVGGLIASRHYRAAHSVQLAKLSRDIATLQPAVVVGWGHEIAVNSFVAAALRRVPRIVFCIRTVQPGRWANEQFAHQLQFAHSRMAGRTAAVIVNSELLKRDYASWSALSSDRISVCANAVVKPATSGAGARVEIRRRFGIAPDAVLLINVGRFSPEKGQMSLLDAAERLRNAGAPPFEWLLCGDGPTLAGVQAEVKRRRLDGFHFTGRTRAVGDLLAASDIFVMPSDFEGMPNAMLEAMTFGLPCVSTNQSGVTDIARDGIEALFYSPGDTAALSNHLLGLMRSSVRASAIGAAGASRVAECTLETSVGCFDAVLAGAMNRHH